MKILRSRRANFLALALLTAGAVSAQSQVTLLHTPAPGGTVITPSVTGDEGVWISYSIEAQDRDTDQVGTNFTEKGDPYVALYKGYAGAPPSSTREPIWAQSGYNATAGTRRITLTVKLKAAPGQPVVDPYLSGDSRGDNLPNYISPIEYWDRTAGGTPIRTPLNQTVIINEKRGEIKGKVKDANTGLPIGADLWIVEAHEDIPDDFPEVVTSSDSITGDYSTTMYAETCTIACGRSYPVVEQTREITVPRDGSITVDFELESYIPPCW
jgi:hypothetical protein